jgi:hypothetical protein
LTKTITTDVTGGKFIAVYSQSISGVRDVNPLVALYEIHGRKGEVLFFCSVPDTTPDMYLFVFYAYYLLNQNQLFKTKREIV